MNKRILAMTAAVICFLLAVGIILYPAVSNYINEKYESVIQTSYEENIAQAEDTTLKEILENARSYNRAISPGAVSDDTYSRESLMTASQGYEKQLCVSTTGVMGYVEIPVIDVYLPIYHGTDSEILEKGIGHLLGSSLPIGGDTTHAVLTGHSGMASRTMFTDLLLLKEGDVFYIHVLHEVLAYKVTEINTVLPHETDLLGIEKGKDICTLVTCTPVSINSHRLLVRGSRIPYEAAQEAVQLDTDVSTETIDRGASWQDQYLQGILWGGITAAILLAFSLLIYKFNPFKRRKRRKGGRYLCKKQSRRFFR